MCRDAQLHLPALQREEEKEGWRGGVKRKAGAQMETVKEMQIFTVMQFVCSALTELNPIYESLLVPSGKFNRANCSDDARAGQ